MAMRKWMTAILLFDLMAGLLFFGLKEQENRVEAASVGTGGTADGREAGRLEEEKTDQEEIKKIAITFDDEVIIGLSQEICYKEAISMI